MLIFSKCKKSTFAVWGGVFICVGIVLCSGCANMTLGNRSARMNNLVSELACRKTASPTDQTVWTFQNPREGWIYIGLKVDDSTTDGLRIGLDNKDIELDRFKSDSVNYECMRWLSEGVHFLEMPNGEPGIRSLVVRAIPEIHYCRYPTDPVIKEYGPYDWAFLKREVLPHVNTIVGLPDPSIDSDIKDWLSRGGKWIAYGSLPHTEGLTADEAYRYWANNPGFQDPRFSGLIADEFQGRENAFYPAWTDALQRMASNPDFAGKKFYGYCGGPGMYTRPQTQKLVRTVLRSDYCMAWERYHHEMPTLAEAEEFMDSLLGKEMVKWRATFPGCEKQMVLVLGLFTHGLSLNVRPDVDYKVWMDMQMRYLATHPAFDGLFGVHFWVTSFADEETLRWMGQLYRHYAIEGKTNPLSAEYGYRYELDHIQNPDFDNGLEHWSIEPAAPGSMSAGYMERYARLQSRYWHRAEFPDEPAGNAFLLTKRQAGKPNRATQVIRNLEPGRLYSVKMITADYQDIRNGQSEEKRFGVSVELEGGEVIPDKSFQATINSQTSSVVGMPFNGQNVAWFNHHRIVFRATQPTGKITISDWAGPNDPGGPAGQELMINGIELQPYYSGDSFSN